MRTGILLGSFVCVLVAVGLWFWSGSEVRTPRPEPVPDFVSRAADRDLSAERPPSPADARSEISSSASGNAMIARSLAVDARPASLPKISILARPTPSGPVASTSRFPVTAKGVEISPESVALDVDKLTLSLRDYRTLMQENPVGTNAEITHALNGGNPKQAKLLPEGQPLNGSGEMVDRWGTPYFFHQLSKDHMEIRSAGPDKTMWTPDDTVSN